MVILFDFLSRCKLLDILGMQLFVFIMFVYLSDLAIKILMKSIEMIKNVFIVDLNCTARNS